MPESSTNHLNKRNSTEFKECFYFAFPENEDLEIKSESTPKTFSEHWLNKTRENFYELGNDALHDAALLKSNISVCHDAKVELIDKLTSPKLKISTSYVASKNHPLFNYYFFMSKAEIPIKQQVTETFEFKISSNTGKFTEKHFSNLPPSYTGPRFASLSISNPPSFLILFIPVFLIFKKFFRKN